MAHSMLGGNTRPAVPVCYLCLFTLPDILFARLVQRVSHSALKFLVLFLTGDRDISQQPLLVWQCNPFATVKIQFDSMDLYIAKKKSKKRKDFYLIFLEQWFNFQGKAKVFSPFFGGDLSLQPALKMKCGIWGGGMRRKKKTHPSN